MYAGCHADLTRDVTRISRGSHAGCTRDMRTDIVRISYGYRTNSHISVPAVPYFSLFKRLMMRRWLVGEPPMAYRHLFKHNSMQPGPRGVQGPHYSHRDLTRTEPGICVYRPGISYGYRTDVRGMYAGCAWDTRTDLVGCAWDMRTDTRTNTRTDIVRIFPDVTRTPPSTCGV